MLYNAEKYGYGLIRSLPETYALDSNRVTGAISDASCAVALDISMLNRTKPHPELSDQ